MRKKKKPDVSGLKEELEKKEKKEEDEEEEVEEEEKLLPSDFLKNWKESLKD